MTRPRQNFPKISTRCHRCCQRPNCKYQLNWISKCQPVFPMPYDKCAKLSPRQTANFDCSTGLHNDLIASPMSCHCNSHYHAIAVPSPFYWVKEGKMASSQLLTSWKSRIRTFSNDRQLYTQASHLMDFCTRHFHLGNEGHPVISRLFIAIFTISLSNFFRSLLSATAGSQHYLRAVTARLLYMWRSNPVGQLCFPLVFY